MKAFAFIAAGAAFAVGPIMPASPVIEPPPPQSSAAVKIDPAEVFRRAFWQPPGAGDKILHAERREWSDSDGVKKWQWFLVVEPSPELVKYLREDNAFGLVPTLTIPAIADAPAWFAVRREEVDGLRAPHGYLHLFFDKTKLLLHATSSGVGFRPGASEAVKTTPPVQAPGGRLPPVPPPTPAKL